LDRSQTTLTEYLWQRRYALLLTLIVLASEEYDRTAAGHEVMRAAARLAEESKELEKAGDSMQRKPYAWSGELMKKAALLDKPERA
jgi:F420-dependent methylenetetrahydromethanopterin dehydrogenase